MVWANCCRAARNVAGGRRPAQGSGDSVAPRQLKSTQQPPEQLHPATLFGMVQTARPPVQSGDGPHAGAYRSPAVGRNGVVASAHGLATTAGLKALLDGGTAIDAAVAVGAALGVVEPYMSGIGGGGGSMLIYEAATRTVHTLDYLGPAPIAATAGTVSTQIR